MKDGGPAFARSSAYIESDIDRQQTSCEQQTGMTLRDYFAGQALNGICAAIKNLPADKTEAACTALIEFSYRMADGMLAEREKERG